MKDSACSMKVSEYLPVLLEEGLILLVFKFVKLVQVLVLESVLMGALHSFLQGLLYDRGRGRRLFRDYAMLAEDVIPAHGKSEG